MLLARRTAASYHELPVLSTVKSSDEGSLTRKLWRRPAERLRPPGGSIHRGCDFEGLQILAACL
jgi:hypothetical protein